jgi:hypothetical protein
MISSTTEGGPEMADVPHLAWPFAMSGRSLATVEQDSIEDVQQNVRSYFSTARGERPLSPDFGLEDPTFGPDVNTTRLAAEIEEAENGRASISITKTGPDRTGRMGISVAVDLAE